ncbi:hypothetical protein BOTBODRAFT_172961 [Botryobasidium botryosum FD-172 SS1]|uniref:Uncharacterized protein n=1 Tax=Botryobasidium botryosum (strain FD-172 SS1) TaxID=930990 RepID=A0A067MP00_BOTB1|nr:hypothetical protein BOTBODRAFT_172961 [Botryobasidium botryosum FD-172 SS1]
MRWKKRENTPPPSSPPPLSSLPLPPSPPLPKSSPSPPPAPPKHPGNPAPSSTDGPDASFKYKHIIHNACKRESQVLSKLAKVREGIETCVARLTEGFPHEISAAARELDGLREQLQEARVSASPLAAVERYNALESEATSAEVAKDAQIEVEDDAVREIEDDFSESEAGDY